MGRRQIRMVTAHHAGGNTVFSTHGKLAQNIQRKKLSHPVTITPPTLHLVALEMQCAQHGAVATSSRL